MKNSISSYVRWRLFRASKSQLRAKSFEDALIIGLEYDVFVLRGCFPPRKPAPLLSRTRRRFSFAISCHFFISCFDLLVMLVSVVTRSLKDVGALRPELVGGEPKRAFRAFSFFSVNQEK